MRSDEQRRGAAELVRRARLYDQNAMAMLQVMAENARAGNKKSQAALEEVQGYIRAHPIDVPVSEGAARALGYLKDPQNPPSVVLDALASLPEVGCKDDITAACVVLGCGPELTDQYVLEMCQGAGEWRDTFLYGLNQSGNEDALGAAREGLPVEGQGALCAGHIIGMGRRLQAAMKGYPEALSEGIAWEVGCG